MQNSVLILRLKIMKMIRTIDDYVVSFDFVFNKVCIMNESNILPLPMFHRSIYKRETFIILITK